VRSLKKILHHLVQLLTIRILIANAPTALSAAFYLLHTAVVNGTMNNFLRRSEHFKPRMQCCESGMFIPDPTFSNPDPGSKLFLSRIRTKEFEDFNPKKWFSSSRKYDPSCSSRIRILTFYPSRIPDPGVKKAPDPGSWILIRNTVRMLLFSVGNYAVNASRYWQRRNGRSNMLASAGRCL
jgi:hypothetical protein